MTRFTTTEQPTSPGIAQIRRRGNYTPRKHDPEQPLALWEFFAVIGGCVLVLAGVVEMALRMA